MGGIFFLIFSFLRGERERGEQRVFLGANPGLCKTISAPERIFNLQQRSLLAEANLSRGRGAGSGGKGPAPRYRQSPSPAREDAFFIPGCSFGDETFVWTDRDWTF